MSGFANSLRSLTVAGLWVLAAVGWARPAHGRHCPDYQRLKNAYFGDLHSHTGYSLDAYQFGTSTDPASAYAFGAGAQIDIGGGNQVSINFTGGKLDFLAVTDHSEWLSLDQGCIWNASSPYYTDPYCLALQANHVPTTAPPCSGTSDNANGSGCLNEAIDAWSNERMATEDAYDPCVFTTFHGYEWTHQTGQLGDKTTLHKNVLFRNANVPQFPLDSISYPDAASLWAALSAQCNAANNCEALTIPHNSNLSSGQAFDMTGYSALDIKHMVKYQKLVEIHQHKGNSECLTDTADSGEITTCDFEVSPTYTEAADTPGYIRPGLETGITYFATAKVNPLKLGFTGSTDTHSGTPGNVGESTWPGHIGFFDNTPQRRLTGTDPTARNPGGITGVWAEENTRESIWAALQRRETFATSGPRMKVRFYAYTGLGDPCTDPDFPASVVSSGVPMGGSVPSGSPAPTFVVYAIQDQAPLAQIDLVKASVIDGVAVESVHSIPLTSPPYCVTWADPSFNPDEPAFYYARVLEQPTWRWSHYDCLRLKQSNPSNWMTIAPGCASNDPSTGGLDYAIQERAWTSPIWNLPGAAVTVQASTLRLRDGSLAGNPGRRSFAFTAKTKRDASEHRITPPVPGSNGDPTPDGAGGGGAVLTVYNTSGGNQRVTMTLPAAYWSVNSSGTKYRFQGPDRNGPIQQVAVTPDSIMIKGGKANWGYLLSTPPQGSVAVRLQLGSGITWCADASAQYSGRPPSSAPNDKVDKFDGQRGAPAPEFCP